MFLYSQANSDEWQLYSVEMKAQIPPASRPNVRKKERTADTFPFDNAVNIADVKLFKPQNRKLYEKIVKPFAAIW